MRQEDAVLSDHRRTILLATAFVTALVPDTAHAQMQRHPQVRTGFWGSFLAGPSSGRFRCDGCTDRDRENGFSGLILIGGTLSPRVLLGAELGIWWKEDVAIGLDVIQTVDVYRYSASFTFYPKAESGFFLRGGAGVASIDRQLSADGSTITYKLGRGPTLTGTFGYDARFARNVSLTVGVSAAWAGLGDLRELTTVIDRHVRFNEIAISLGFTWH
jgi:hypothetical protein